uniref:DHX35 n=2 Tax=Catharus ustulatus TaxID=91951 RepID=A0A8C3UNM0_CATUS
MAAPVGPVKFWKPGSEGPGVSVSEERQSPAESSAVTVIYNPYASLSIEQQRQKLPVFKLRNHILYLVENYQTLVIIGETGCGKSTQIPQYLAEAGWTAEGRVVGVTQPRRSLLFQLQAELLMKEVQCWDMRLDIVSGLTTAQTHRLQELR